MGAVYARAKAGHRLASDPHMSMADLHDFASTSTKGLPARAGGGVQKRGGGAITSARKARR